MGAFMRIISQTTYSLVAAPRWAGIAGVFVAPVCGGVVGMKQRLCQNAVADPRKRLF